MCCRRSFLLPLLLLLLLLLLLMLLLLRVVVMSRCFDTRYHCCWTFAACLPAIDVTRPADHFVVETPYRRCCTPVYVQRTARNFCSCKARFYCRLSFRTRHGCISFVQLAGLSERSCSAAEFSTPPPPPQQNNIQHPRYEQTQETPPLRAPAATVPYVWCPPCSPSTALTHSARWLLSPKLFNRFTHQTAQIRRSL